MSNTQTFTIVLLLVLIATLLRVERELAQAIITDVLSAVAVALVTSDGEHHH